MNKLTHNKFLKKFQEHPKLSQKYILLSEYHGTEKPVVVMHLECGRIFEKDPKHLLRGQGCPYCFPAKYTKKLFSERILALIGTDYELLSDFVDVHTKVKLKHSCGTEFEMRPTDFLNGQRCPICSKKDAINKKIGTTYERKTFGTYKNRESENEFISFIQSITKTPTQIHIIFKPNFKKPEFFKVSIQSAKICFKLVPDIPQQEYPVKKQYEYLENIGYQLIIFTESEWTTKREIVEKKIKNLLKVDYGIFISAKNCEVKSVSSKDAREYILNNTTEEYKPSNYRFGLYYNDTLVYLMTFKCPKKTINEYKPEYLLLQIASSQQVFGGFSLLLNTVINEYNIKILSTIVNLKTIKKSENIYIVNGFLEKSINFDKKTPYGRARYVLNIENN